MYPFYERQEHFEIFMDRVEIPPDARAYLRSVQDAINADPEQRGAFETLVVDFMHEPQTRIENALGKMGQMAAELNYNAYTFHFLLLVNASYILRKQYDKAGIKEEVFWDTMHDLKYKLAECVENHHVYGTFVGWWYKKIFSGDIFMLGRLQYERNTYPMRETYKRAGIRVDWGDPVLSIHIPSCGPLTEPQRMDSYRRAYNFFSHDGQPIVCICDSWLLHKGHEEFLPEQSNIRSFMRDFDIIESRDHEKPQGSWRIFGSAAVNDPATWPEDTGLQKAYKQHILSVGSTGSGFGILIFDGEKIIR
jgi:hypothetical protein